MDSLGKSDCTGAGGLWESLSQILTHILKTGILAPSLLQDSYHKEDENSFTPNACLLPSA